MPILVAALLAASMPAQDDGWALQPPAGNTGAVLTLRAGDKMSYRFECTASDVAVTETGATELIDLRDGKKIGDGPDATMPDGGAMMALFGGKGNPDFKPAEAVKNPAGGWDLTIRLAKDDKQLKAIGKSDVISLFTTGYTIAVAMDASSRATWKDFMQRCQPAG